MQAMFRCFRWEALIQTRLVSNIQTRGSRLWPKLGDWSVDWKGPTREVLRECENPTQGFCSEGPSQTVQGRGKIVSWDCGGNAFIPKRDHCSYLTLPPTYIPVPNLVPILELSLWVSYSVVGWVLCPLVKTHLAGPQPQSFMFTVSGVGSRNLNLTNPQVMLLLPVQEPH
jgi:hypothetical protein